MTDDVAQTNEGNSLDEERIQKLANYFVAGSDQIADLPRDAEITRDLLWLFLAFADENGDTSPPQEEVTKLLVRSMFRLERRLLDVENALRARGLLD